MTAGDPAVAAALGAAAPGARGPGVAGRDVSGRGTAVRVVRSLGDARPGGDGSAGSPGAPSVAAPVRDADPPRSADALPLGGSPSAARPPAARPSVAAGRPLAARVRDHLELVRAPAVLTVLGDTVAGASAAGLPLTGRRALLPLASACLYAGGMALNDWADRDVDAVERPERPIPSGRVPAGHALRVAGGLGAAGLALAAVAGGRRALAVAVPLAAAVWLYDARLKDTPAGPVAMAACRGLDVLLGAGAGHLRAAAPAAVALAAHTFGVTVLSRGEVRGTTRGVATAVAAGTVTVAAAALAALEPRRPARSAPVTLTAELPRRALRPRPSAAAVPATPEWIHSHRRAPASPPRWIHSLRGEERDQGRGRAWGAGGVDAAAAVATAVSVAAYLAQCLPAQAATACTPTAAAARAATGAGIRAMIPLQAAWAARAGRPGAALALGAVAVAGALLRRATGPRAVSET